MIEGEWRLLNLRRCELIRKDVKWKLTMEEEIELMDLEEKADLEVARRDAELPPDCEIQRAANRLKAEGRWPSDE